MNPVDAFAEGADCKSSLLGCCCVSVLFFLDNKASSLLMVSILGKSVFAIMSTQGFVLCFALSCHSPIHDSIHIYCIVRSRSLGARHVLATVSTFRSTQKSADRSSSRETPPSSRLCITAAF